MIDVSAKPHRERTARAHGELWCSAETLRRVEAGDLPKGDLFNVARAAGLLAIKRTPDLIPHCHPVAIDGAQVDFRTESRADDRGVVHVSVLVKSIARTGPEMEALTAVSVVLAVIYDLLKIIDKDMQITNIRLGEKTGGKSDARLRVREGLSAAVIACSAAVAGGRKDNAAAEAVAARVAALGVKVVSNQVIALEQDAVAAALRQQVEAGVDFVFTVGGVGVAEYEFLPELLRSLGEREAPGIGERMRADGAAHTPLAMFTRPLAVVWGQTLVVALPGSTSGARESLDAVLPGLFQAPRMIGRRTV